VSSLCTSTNAHRRRPRVLTSSFCSRSANSSPRSTSLRSTTGRRTFRSPLDLSSFYHWPEDLPLVLAANPDTIASLHRLNLLTTSFTKGFKSHQIESIPASCPNLEHFLVPYNFDPRYIRFIGGDTLLAIASNCPKPRCFTWPIRPHFQITEKTRVSREKKVGLASKVIILC